MNRCSARNLGKRVRALPKYVEWTSCWTWNPRVGLPETRTPNIGLARDTETLDRACPRHGSLRLGLHETRPAEYVNLSVHANWAMCVCNDASARSEKQNQLISKSRISFILIWILSSKWRWVWGAGSQRWSGAGSFSISSWQSGDALPQKNARGAKKRNQSSGNVLWHACQLQLQKGVLQQSTLGSRFGDINALRQLRRAVAVSMGRKTKRSQNPASTAKKWKYADNDWWSQFLTQMNSAL